MPAFTPSLQRWLSFVPSTETIEPSKAMNKRSRPKIDKQVPNCNASAVAKPESKNEPSHREPAVLREQGGMRPRRPRRSFATIDDEWSRLERQRGRLKEALLTDREIPEAVEPAQPKKSDTVAESKYEPTDYERAVLAKQAQRLEDQIRVPRIRFVEDYRGGRREFDHPDQAIASALLKEAFGTADDQFAKGLVGYLCAALPADENSGYRYPTASDLNYAISLIAAGKAVDEIHAEILADMAVCRLTRERLLYNLREPLKFDLSDELKFALYYHKHNPKDQIDREVKIDNRPLLEFSLRYATRLMITEIELIAAADRHRAIVESYREMQELSAVTPEGANLREIKHATPKARLKKANAAPTRRLNGSVVPKLPQKIDSATARRSNGHTPT